MELSSPNAAIDHERLKYVTENFTNLQGLNMALFGLAFGFMRVSLVVFEGSHWGWIGVLGTVIIMVPMFGWVPRYYRTRFGFVRQVNALSGFDKWTPTQMIVGFIAFALSLVLIQESTRHLMFGSMELMYSLGFIILGLKDKAKRIYFVPLGLMMEVIALVPLWGILSPDQLRIWKMVNAGALGLVILVGGICDHVLLARLMPKKAQEVEQ